MKNKQLQNIIEKYQITKTNNIIYGTNIPMPKKIVPTANGVRISFEQSEYYFFYFDEHGIKIYPIDGGTYLTFSWNEVIDFKISHIWILGKMTIKTADSVYKFQINRFVFGCPWIKENTKYLELNKYFYNK